MAIPPSLSVFVSDWSLFDILCLFYIIKDWALNALAIGGAILMSHDPQEAYARLMQMKASGKRHRQEQFPNIILPDNLHDSLFKKGFIRHQVQHMLGY